VLARDPFRPLYVAPPPPAAVGTAVPGATTTAANGQSVTLVKVFSRNGKTYAQTMVGRTVYTTMAGQTFGGTFEVLAINGRSATYLQGDEQFSLSVGQNILR
jgi:hypothetical protein